MNLSGNSRYKDGLLNGAVGLSAGLAIAYFVSRIGAMGHWIPSSQLNLDYLVALFWAFGIGIYLLCLPVPLQERRDLVVLWGARCAVTLLAMLIYENHYSLDAYSYYEKSKQAGFDWSNAGYGKGTDNTEGLSWLMNHYLPIMDSFHALKVCYSFIGYLGCFIIYRAFAPFCGANRRSLLYLIFLFPSMIFWSSILGKDPVILLGIAIYVYGTIRFVYRGKPIFILPMAAGILLAATFRSWYLPILVLPLLSLGIRGIKRTSLKVVFIALILAGSAYSAQMFADQFQVASVGDLVDRTRDVSHQWSRGGSAKIAPTFSSIGSMLSFAPLGMFTALFRPLPGEVMNPFGLLAGFENLFLLGFIVKSIGAIRKRSQRLREPLATWAIALILIWSFIYGFVSYQNLGAGVRFRLQILPVMLCLLYFLVSDEEEPDVRYSGSD